MESETCPAPDAARRRRWLNRSVRESLKDLSVQLSLLNHQVGSRLELRGTDLECFDLIDRHAPVTPSELARRSGLHPATVTGILDRLERGGWIARHRDIADRRGVLVQPVRGRVGDVLRLYTGMNAQVEQICADYGEDELELLVGFLRRTAEAGRVAAAELADRRADPAGDDPGGRTETG